MNNVEKNSVPADPSRKLTGTAPFRVIAGRGIVDAEGRVIAHCQARAVEEDGITTWAPSAGFTFAEADDNAHGIAHVLNAHDAMRAGLRYILEAANAASVGALHSDTFSAERVAQWARDAMNGMFPVGEPPTVTNGPADALRDAMRAALDTLDACGSISDSQTAMLRAFADWPDPLTRAEMMGGGDGMNTAQKIIETIRQKQWAGVSLAMGYATMTGGERVTFEPCRVIAERRNGAGRCEMLLGEYADGSRIRFTWSEYAGAKYMDASPKPQDFVFYVRGELFPNGASVIIALRGGHDAQVRQLAAMLPDHFISCEGVVSASTRDLPRFGGES